MLSNTDQGLAQFDQIWSNNFARNLAYFDPHRPRCGPKRYMLVELGPSIDSWGNASSIAIALKLPSNCRTIPSRAEVRPTCADMGRVWSIFGMRHPILADAGHTFSDARVRPLLAAMLVQVCPNSTKIDQL